MAPGRAPLLAAVVLVLMSSWAFAQGTAPGPGTGAGGAATPGGRGGGQRAGLPPRDRQQPVPVGTGQIRGRVAGLDGSPLRRALVELSGVETPPVRKATMTDADGRYSFAELPAGRYTIRATKGGYVTFAHGQRVLNEAVPPVTLGDGDALTGIDVVLPRGSVIAGRITDEFGDPVLQAQVQALRYQYQPDGQRRLVPGGNQAATDDLGQFRLYGLTPGEYVISASARNQPSGRRVQQEEIEEGYAPTFYPGSSNAADAQPISVALSQEVSIQLQLTPARLGRISGTVFDSQGRPATSGTVMLRSATNLIGPIGGSTGISGDGAFSLSNVAPGDYLLEVRPRPGPPGRNNAPPASAEFASVPITVNGGELSGLRIVTGNGASVSGRVVIEGAAPPAGMRIRVVAQPVDPIGTIALPGRNRGDEGVVGADGSFELAGLTGPVFLRVTLENARGAGQGEIRYMTKSVFVDGVDVADMPFDPSRRGTVNGVTVVLTDKITGVTGAVTDSRGAAAGQATVLIVPEDLPAGVSPTRFIRVLRSDDTGKFQVRAMPVGRYTAVAVEAFDPARQYDPDVQQRARQLGKSFSLRDGETVTLDLKLSGTL